MEMTTSVTNNCDISLLRKQDGNFMLIDDAIELIGCGRFQHRILAAAGFCFMADSMEIMLLSFLSTILKEEWGLSSTEAASITSCVFAGAILGTLILGPMGDKYGRFPIFLLSGLIISVFGFGTALTWGFSSFLLARFMVGFGVGGLTVPFDILAEFLPDTIRGKYLLLIEYFWTAGSIITPIVASLTIRNGGSWKLFVIICAIPCLISVVAGVIFVPESPRWLISKGRDSEALEILRSAAEMNGKDPDTIFPPGTQLLVQNEEVTSELSDLLKPKWRKLTLTLWVVWAGFAFSYYGTIMTVTLVFGKDDDEDDFDYGAIFSSSCSEILGVAVAISLIDKIGRIPTQVGSYFLGGICVFLMCFYADEAGRNSLLVISFAARAFEMIGNCVTWVSTAELLSTEIRSTGHSAANAVARLGAFCSPYVVYHLNLRHLGILMLIIHFITVIAASRLPETKGKHLGKVTGEISSDDRILSNEDNVREVL